MHKVIDFSSEELRNILGSKLEYDFDLICDQVFAYQEKSNPLYQKYIESTYQENLPMSRFLPIEAFKKEVIKSGNWQEVCIFESSGTTGMINAKHAVRNLDFYHQNAIRDFERSFGSLEGSCILALLPHYLERGNSSLVSMVAAFIERSGHASSGFYLREFDLLYNRLKENQELGLKTILFGVTYALLAFLDKLNSSDVFDGLLVIETGGMKGFGPEITREELHDRLKSGFTNATISSEYGMTELLSQAYLAEDGFFYPGQNMRVLITEINDPFSEEKTGKTGVINVIDLSNIDTCSFIKTQDLGRSNGNGGFQVLGRLDHSDLRGCNLMVQDIG